MTHGGVGLARRGGGKCPSGIAGLDEVTHGGLPAGRATLLCGGPGCGKSLLALEFLARGATEHGEPGLFVSFAERPEELMADFPAGAPSLEELVAAGKLLIVPVEMASHDTVAAGAFTLDGLLIRIAEGIERVGAKRVAIDTLEVLFASLPDGACLRSEVARLFEWLKDQAVTAVVTGERTGTELTRHGFEEFVSDCVVLLDHRIQQQISKRRLRIVKYRGSAHGKDEYPFLISDDGFSVLPITSVSLDHEASADRVSTGVADLDEMLGGAGFYRGSTVLVSGTAGTGKSTLAAAFAEACCQRGEQCLMLCFEEGASQVVRNMRSVGTDLAPWIERGLLHLQAIRPSRYGLEEHLVTILHEVARMRPAAVILDPVTDFLGIGDATEVKSMLTRMLDQFRALGSTVLMTSLTTDVDGLARSRTDVSSLMDTWIAITQRTAGSALRRKLCLVKSRGMAHSHEVRGLRMSAEGIALTTPRGDDGTRPAEAQRSR